MITRTRLARMLCDGMAYHLLTDFHVHCDKLYASKSTQSLALKCFLKNL